jgi:homogentisate 1,2-dioxygenase
MCDIKLLSHYDDWGSTIAEQSHRGSYGQEVAGSIYSNRLFKTPLIRGYDSRAGAIHLMAKGWRIRPQSVELKGHPQINRV